MPAEALDYKNYLAQETWLAHDTIANNIRLGHPDATLAEGEMAAEKASIASFIHTLTKLSPRN